MKRLSEKCSACGSELWLGRSVSCYLEAQRNSALYRLSTEHGLTLKELKGVFGLGKSLIKVLIRREEEQWARILTPQPGRPESATQRVSPPKNV